MSEGQGEKKKNRMSLNLKKTLELQAKIKLLDKEEILTPIELSETKSFPINFIHSLILPKFTETIIEEKVAKNTIDCLKTVQNEVKDILINGEMIFSEKKNQTIADLLDVKTSYQEKLELEERIILQTKIKEISENKGEIVDKIKTLEEQLKLLENNRDLLNISKSDSIIQYPKEVIEDNIRRSRIKEIKFNKETLENKVKSLDGVIRTLMQNEETHKNKNKVSIKTYLENFDKDKKEAEALAKKWEKDRQERLEKLLKAKERNEEKAKQIIQKKEQEEKEKENRKREEMEKHIKNMHEKHEKSLVRLNELGEGLNKSGSQKHIYSYLKLDKEFQLKVQQQKSSYEKQILEEIEKKKQIFLKPMDFKELSDFKKVQEIKSEELKLKRSKERVERFTRIQEANSKHNQVKIKSDHYKQNEKDFGEIINKEKKKKEEKDINLMKVKNFGKIVKENMSPSVNEFLKKKREENIIKKPMKFVKRGRNPHNKYMVKLLKKHDGVGHLSHLNSSKFSYEESVIRPQTAISKKRRKLFLENYDVKNNRPLSTKYNNEDSLFYSSKNIKEYTSKKLPEKRVPLEKNPNYLEILKNDRKKKSSTKTVGDITNSKKWDKLIFKKSIGKEGKPNELNLQQNIRNVKSQAKLLEEKAKMKERLMHYSGGAANNPELGDEVTDMYIESLKAKLSILDSLN